MKTKTLSAEAQKLFRKLSQEWSITDAAGRLVLETALVAYDELKAAQHTLATEGTYVTDRFKQLRLHPAAQREKECRAHLLQALKHLNLDLESLEGNRDAT